MIQKLKGCRPSQVAMQDYSNVSAQLGDAVFQIHQGHQTKQRLLNRQRELVLEIQAAQEQEAKKEAPEASQPPQTTPEVTNG